MMNIGVMLRLCTLEVCITYSLRLLMKFEIYLNIWLMIRRIMTMLERPLVVPLPTLI